MQKIKTGTLVFSLGAFIHLLAPATFALDSTLPFQVTVEQKNLPPPPLLKSASGGIVNVSHQGTARQVDPGEWLRFGDQFKLNPKIAIQLIFDPGIQVVAGTAFSGAIHSPLHMHVERGWIKVWVKADHDFTVDTPSIALAMKEGTYWMSVRPELTQIYLISGSVTDSSGLTAEVGLTTSQKPIKRYFAWKKNRIEGGSVSREAGDWNKMPNGKSLDQQIAKLFPSLSALDHLADHDWRYGETADFFAQMSKNRPTGEANAIPKK